MDSKELNGKGIEWQEAKAPQSNEREVRGQERQESSGRLRTGWDRRVMHVNGMKTQDN